MTYDDLLSNTKYAFIFKKEKHLYNLIYFMHLWLLCYLWIIEFMSSLIPYSCVVTLLLSQIMILHHTMLYHQEILHSFSWIKTDKNEFLNTVLLLYVKTLHCCYILQCTHSTALTSAALVCCWIDEVLSYWTEVM